MPYWHAVAGRSLLSRRRAVVGEQSASCWSQAASRAKRNSRGGSRGSSTWPLFPGLTNGHSPLTIRHRTGLECIGRGSGTEGRRRRGNHGVAARAPISRARPPKRQTAQARRVATSGWRRIGHVCVQQLPDTVPRLASTKRHTHWMCAAAPVVGKTCRPCPAAGNASPWPCCDRSRCLQQQHSGSINAHQVPWRHVRCRSDRDVGLINKPPQGCSRRSVVCPPQGPRPPPCLLAGPNARLSASCRPL